MITELGEPLREIQEPCGFPDCPDFKEKGLLACLSCRDYPEEAEPTG